MGKHIFSGPPKNGKGASARLNVALPPPKLGFRWHSSFDVSVPMVLSTLKLGLEVC